ncbi:MAG: Transcriptional regulatory protein YycF [Chloroflexi bacterium ADurb.Bin360]|nr:MAG: Transcriptional regulatory protein YycF [Chloroflexi bacterium ADurb.Bin360]
MSMEHTILVVEDQVALLDNIQLALELSGYCVLTATDGLAALEVLRAQAVDLILADIAMPRMNGYQLYEAVRANLQWMLVSFVFISARGLDSDVRYGKAMGADDYLVKPFEVADLLAIVEGRLRRARDLAQLVKPVATGASGGSDPAPDALSLGSLRISPAQHRVWKAGALVELSPREFAFLLHLAQRPGEVVTLQELCRVTHGLETTSAEAGKLLYALVRSLRRRLGYATDEMGCIVSVRGVGYRLEE